MDNIDYFNASVFDYSLRIDLQTLKLAELIQVFFSMRISIIEANYENKDKNLLEIMDSMNMITDEVENFRKNSVTSSNIEEIELKLSVRSNSSSKMKKEKEMKQAINETPKIFVINKHSNIDITSNLKSKKNTYISRSPERLTNKLILSASPRNEKKEVVVTNKNKVSEKIPIQEIVLNNLQKTNKLAITQENWKKAGIERRGSPNQGKGSITNNFNSNNTFNKNATTSKPTVKCKIEVITIGNLTRTRNISPVNNKSKNVKIQHVEIKEKEKVSKFKNDTYIRKGSANEVKSRSPIQKEMNYTKLLDGSPKRKSFEYQNNDTSVNSNEKLLKQERTNIMSNEVSIHEITKSINCGNSSILSSCNEVNISSTLSDKLRKFFNMDNSLIFIHLYRYFRVREKIIFKNINNKMRKSYFENEIFQFQKKIKLKKPEENPFYKFALKNELESQIKTENLFLSDYFDNKNVTGSLTFMNLVSMIYRLLYSERSDSKSLTDKIEKIEDFFLQIDFDRNIYSKIPTLIRKLNNSIDIFYILRGVYDSNTDNFIFNFDLPKKFDSLIKFAISISVLIENGQNIEVVLDIEIFNHKIDILKAYSDKQF